MLVCACAQTCEEQCARSWLCTATLVTQVFLFFLQGHMGTPFSAKTTFRRPLDPGVDGPFPLQPGESSTRVKQIAKALAVANSGLAPGQYNSDVSKDWCMRGASGGACMSRTDRAQRHAPRFAESLSAALARGQTWVGVARQESPVAARAQPRSASEQYAAAAARMPRMAEGSALELPSRGTSHSPPSIAIPTAVHSAEDVAASDQPAQDAEGTGDDSEGAPNAAQTAQHHEADTDTLDEANVVVDSARSTRDDTDEQLDASHEPRSAGGARAANSAQAPRAQQAPLQSRQPDTHVVGDATAHESALRQCARGRHVLVPLKPPPPAVARSAAQGDNPGNWDWAAASRALCNTFTMQDGGAFRRDRARAQMTVDEAAASRRLAGLEASQSPADRDVQHLVQRSAASTPQDIVHGAAGATGDSVGHGRRAGAAEQHGNAQRRSKAELVDAKAQAQHEAALRAAEAARGVRERQQRWEMQSALLPVLKRDAIFGRLQARLADGAPVSASDG
jgi:hypothetical protein